MLAGSTNGRRRLGTDLRRLREAKALRLEEVASCVGVAASTLSRIETGQAPTRMSYLAIMLDLYGVSDPDQRKRLTDLSRESQRRGWWAQDEDLLPAGTGRYLGLESEASALCVFGVQLVHDLVRTPEYARAVIAAERPDLRAAQAERLLAIQLRRQQALTASTPLQLHLVLDESALYRSVAPAGVMRAQLEHLSQLGSQPSICVQVLPLRATERPILAGPFAIVSFAEPGDGDVATVEGFRGQLQLEQRTSEVQAMRRVFDALTSHAWPVQRSVTLIRELAKKL